MKNGMRMVCGSLLLVLACANDETAGDATPVTPDLEDAAVARVTGSVELDVVPYEAGAVATTSNFDTSRPIEGQTREQLADALRPVLLKGDGKLYIASVPNWPAADAAITSGVATRDVGADTARARPIDDDPHGDLPDGVHTAEVIGPDGRTVVTNTTVAPYRNMARVIIVNNDGGAVGCTGSYIGPWTFILAGHCVRQPDGTVARRMIIEPGRNGASLPFGSFDCRNDDATTSNNFLLAIPAGYVSSADSNYDFAIVDTFPCHRAPHWFGEPATNQGIVVNSGTTTYGLHGYPGPACPGAPGGGLYNCGMSGSAYVNGSWLETELLDADHGQSGGPWHVGGRVAGTLIGYREYFDLFRCGFDVCRRTFGRRIDDTYLSFLRTISFDY